jgi:hypothetical protein
MYLSTYELTAIIVLLVLLNTALIYAVWQNKNLLRENNFLRTINRELRDRYRNYVEKPF